MAGEALGIFKGLFAGLEGAARSECIKTRQEVGQTRLKLDDATKQAAQKKVALENQMLGAASGEPLPGVPTG